MSYLQSTQGLSLAVVAAAVFTITACFLKGFFGFFNCWNWRQRGQHGQQTMGPMKSWPILGTAVEHLRNYHRMHDWLLGYFERNTTISAPMPGGRMYYYTVDIENVKYILKTNFNNFPKGEVYHERMEVLLGDGIFNTDGEKWKQQRKTASAEFSMKSLRDFNVVAFKDEALKLARLLHEIEHQGVSFDMQDLFMRMTLDSIGKVGFGVEIGSLPWQLPLPDNTFAKAFDLCNEIVTRRFIDPMWKIRRLLNIGCEAKLQRSIKVLDCFTYGVIAQRKREISRAKNLQAAGGPIQAPLKLDIITRFLELSKDENNCMDYKTLRDIVLNFVIAGRDTTAVTLSWFVYSLIENPDVAHRLYEELRGFETRKRMLRVTSMVDTPDATAGSYCVEENFQEFSKLLTYDSLKFEELPYLQAVISETLRLYPAVPLDPKEIKEDVVLPDGTHLKKGGLISYSPYCMARVPYIWGPDAKEFKPDRWLQDGKFHPESEFKFATFQAGQRMCLGKDSAYLQMKITAAILCRFFEFKRVEGQNVRYRMMSILSIASGLKVTVRVRREHLLLS